MTESVELRALRETAEAQDAYGKRNTTPAWNRYHTARRAAQSPLRRLVSKVGKAVGLVLLLSVAYLPIVQLFKGVF